MHFFSRSKLITTFSSFLIIIGLALFGSTRLTTHAASANFKPSQVSSKSSTQPQLKCGRWHVISSPPGTNNILVGAAATSANDAWSVGWSYNYSSGTNETLTEHWNGTSWSIVASPSPGPYDNLLRGVATISTSDAWAVGLSWYSNNTQTLIEHWDGTNWNAIPSPNAGSHNDLYGVTALSPSDVWAVGYFFNINSNFSQTLIEHWDGTSWTVVPSPNPNDYNAFRGVTALSPSDVWAVGFSSNINTNISQTLIEHWDGTSWTVVPSPNPDPKSNLLLGITQVPGTGQLWAAGEYHSKTLTEHWDGTSWTVVPSPNLSLKDNVLEGIVALSTDDVWAVGLYGANQILIEHWDGTSWTIASHPKHDGVLFGVAQVPGTSQVWTVGEYYGKIQSTLIEFYC